MTIPEVFDFIKNDFQEKSKGVFLDALFSLKDNIFLELLFFDNPQIYEISKYVARTSKLFVGAVFVAGSLWEFFRENQYRELILRTIFCLIIFSSYESFLAESLKTSFEVSQKIMDMGSKNNRLIDGFRKAGLMAKKESKKEEQAGFWGTLLKMAKALWKDPISTVIWILTYIAFMLLGIIYTIIFSLFLPSLAPHNCGTLKIRLQDKISSYLFPKSKTVHPRFVTFPWSRKNPK